MESLLTCPRCNAFAQPEWPSCKICGYDPSGTGPYESIYAPKPKPVRPGFGQTLGALVTLVMLVAIFAIAGTFIYNRYQHRDASQLHQELVSIDR